MIAIILLECIKSPSHISQEEFCFLRYFDCFRNYRNFSQKVASFPFYESSDYNKSTMNNDFFYLEIRGSLGSRDVTRETANPALLSAATCALNAARASPRRTWSCLWRTSAWTRPTATRGFLEEGWPSTSRWRTAARSVAKRCCLWSDWQVNEYYRPL